MNTIIPNLTQKKTDCCSYDLQGWEVHDPMEGPVHYNLIGVAFEKSLHTKINFTTIT